MNNMIVPENFTNRTDDLLEELGGQLDQLTPQLRKAASYILENPNEVGISSIRELADAAEVKPNSLVRMARTIGFDGYEEFRERFREDIRNGQPSFPDRARWLQSLSKGGRLNGLFADMAASAIANIEQSFAETDAKQIEKAAKLIVKARKVFILGVGVNHALARSFTYLADMAVDNVTAIPRDGNIPIDELAHAGKDDLLLAMAFKPYRTEVVEAIAEAKRLRMKVIGMSDSPASPVIAQSDIGFVIQSDTPQFFPSTVATAALLETLMAFVVAAAGRDVVRSIEAFHERRHQLGIYMS